MRKPPLSIPVARAAAIALAAALLPGCSLFDEERELLQVFVVVLTISAALNLLLIGLLVFYFLPFTRPLRKRRRR